MEQKRFLLAMVLSGAVLVLWQVFLAPQPVEEEQSADEQAVQVDEDQPTEAQKEAQDGEPRERADQQPAEPAEPAAEARAEAEADAQPAAERPDVAVRQDVIKTRWFTLELTNDHGSITSAHLTEPDQYTAKGDLIGFPEGANQYPFQTSFLDGNFDFPENPVYTVVEDASVQADGEGYSKLVYRYADPQGRFTVDKIFEVDPELPYVVNMDVVLTNKLSQGTLVDTLAVDIFDWKDPNEESSFLDFQPNEVTGVCRNTEDIERESFDSVVEESQRFAAGETQWAGVDTRYFLMAAIPAEPAERCELDVVDDNYLRTRLVHKSMSVAAGSSETVSHQLFLGPKDVDVLHEVGHRLEESVDYGFFAFIARPMRWGLNQLFNIVGNWGLAIILLTFIIRGALWPINMKAYSSMERMKQVQPMLKELKEKYKDDRQRMTEETMKVFREHNVSPAGGCLPMIMQMPILYGLYVMIYNSVDLYHADFALWYTNLAEPDPYYILPALMGIVMFAQQRMSTVDQSNKQAAMMMKIMPVMFTAFMVFLPSGLVLYYALSLLIGVLQQFYVRKKFRGEDEETAKA